MHPGTGLAPADDPRVAAYWVLTLGALAWAASLCLYLVVSRTLFADLGILYGQLGASAPVPTVAYFRVSGLAWPLVTLAAAVTPARALLAGRADARRLMRWATRYGMSAALGFAWAAIGVALWRLSVQQIGATLR